MKKYPVYQPYLNGNEKKYVMNCLDSTWISSKGRYVQKFEQRFADYLGVFHACSVCSGTVALHLALLALGIGKGDEVIVPTLTYIASANAIRYTGATPIFVDSNMNTWQMSPDSIRMNITPATKAILVVHLYGHPCDMDSIKSIADDFGLFIIEDCAEAFGSKYKGKVVGTFGDISTFSFFGNKTITTGEGGMIVTNNCNLYNRCCSLKNQGLNQQKEYWHDTIGYNFRMTNICAAIGLAQIEQANRIIERKRTIAQWYIEELKDMPITFQSELKDIFHTWWMVSFICMDTEERDRLRKHLKDNGVETRPLFYPISIMPVYSQKYKRYQNAEYLSERGICLPSYPALEKIDVENISTLIKEFFK